MQSQTIHEFGVWLAATPASVLIQTVSWIIPTVQSLHILAIATVLACVALIDLRLIGAFSKRESLADIVQRFAPWMWRALLVLLLSGSILITAEPGRSLENPAFQLKLIMIVTVATLMYVVQRALRIDGQYWALTASRRWTLRSITGASVVLWVSIVIAGRWIAYAGLV